MRVVYYFTKAENENQNPDSGDDTDDNHGDITDSSEPEFSFGDTADNTYQNAFLGIACTLPSDWVFYTDEQIMQLNNITGEYYEDDVAEVIKNATIIYDMYAQQQSTGNNINVNLEKLSPLQIATLNIKQTLESQIGTVKSTYQNMGFTDIDAAYSLVTVVGREFDALEITAKIQGTDFYCTCFSFKKGTYLASVTVSAVQINSIDTILGYFTVA